MSGQARTEKTAPSVLTKSGFSREALEALSSSKEEPEWLQGLRSEAWRVFQDTPMPSGKDEEWRKTEISDLSFDEFRPWGEGLQAVDDVEKLPTQIRDALVAERGGALVQHNGAIIYNELHQELRDKGVVLSSLAQAAREHPELVQEHLMTRAVPPTEGKFEALNGAFWSGGAFLYVPRNVEVELPLQAYFWMDEPRLGFFQRTLVIAGENSDVTFIEDRGSPTLDKRALNSGVIEVYVGSGARVRYGLMQEWGQHVWDFTTARAVSDRDSMMIWVIGPIGSGLNKLNLDSRLEGEAAATEIYGAFFADENQHLDMLPVMHHVGLYTSGDLLMKGALADQGRSVFRGLIKIDKGAQHTLSYLSDHNLMLSDSAHADAIPTLEIEANEVRASHGATVGRVDDEQLFYMLSRGVPREQAVRLIVDGFFADVWEQIPIEPAREKLRRAVERKIEKHRADY